MGNPLLEVINYGQSLWYDNIRRGLIISGELQQLIKQDGLLGVTSNPSIFEKAIAGSADYNNALRALERQRDVDAKTLYEQLAIGDIQDAADVMYQVYEKTKKRDGYVSFEVSPYLANDTQGTLDEAHRLWQSVGRDNVMIKVPATAAGVPAIKQLISEEINVNVTLLFSLEAYEQVAEAYISGIEAFVARGGDPSGIASVASFFISRIDSAIDGLITARLKSAKTAGERALLRSILGKIAIANAKLTYQRYKEIYSTDRWKALAAKGAQTQRLLWASTSTKNPNYRDVIYVEELMGADTVNTVPSATYDAFRDHGRPRASLEEHVEEAYDAMDVLAQVGISMGEVTDKLLDDAVKLFADAFDKLLSAVEKKRKSLLGADLDRITYKLPDSLATAVKASLEDWRVNGKVRRLWAGDKTLWTNDDENRWLGWLGITDDQLAHIEHLKGIGAEIKNAGFSHALLLGMGGSSLCPEVMKMTFGKIDGYPELQVLDSTDPAQVKTFEGKVDLANTIFIVSSKSGGTLEPNIFKQYFFERVKQVVGAEEAGNRFIAITDPGSKMQQVAEGDGFRRIFFGWSSIGGRYSALSDFGMVPSAIMGVDVEKFLDRAEEMVHSCASCVPPDDNPGVVLGTIMGVLANNGRDKVTIIPSPGIWDLGAWLEQLLAESTGKVGKGLIPVDMEKLSEPSVYGNDRLFAYLRLDSAPDAAQDAAISALENAGQPVVRISISEIYDLGEEMFRWQIATAVAGAIIGINAFNQPDVEASKIATKKLTSEYEKTGSLPAESPVLEDGEMKLFTDDKNASALAQAAGGNNTLDAYIKAHLDRIGAGDYFCVSAYVEMNHAHQEILQDMRHAVRDAKRSATCLGYGPRFLHSTGQAYKGGPNSGVFLQITCDDAEDLAVPGQKYTFGTVKAAQARGDFQVLVERDRRALRVHLGRDVKAGLAALRDAVKKAL
ncbi:MAG: bifunctional transaldolase/phosoglucose isomerase [Deltaproteobacteria bacterium]